jgi:hypothetical protein
MRFFEFANTLFSGIRVAKTIQFLHVAAGMRCGFRELPFERLHLVSLSQNGTEGDTAFERRHVRSRSADSSRQQLFPGHHIHSDL